MMYFYMTEVVSPLFGAAGSTADELHSVAWYANELGAATSVAERYSSDTMYTTEVAAPYGVHNRQGCAYFMRLKSHPRSNHE
jgi:hypothetical protein